MSYRTFPRTAEQIEADHRASLERARRSGWTRIARRPEVLRQFAAVLLPETEDDGAYVPRKSA